MCDFHVAGAPCEQQAPTEAVKSGRVSRRHLLGAVGVSAAAVTAGGLIGRPQAAQAATQAAAQAAAQAAGNPASGLSLTLLGTNGGPPPLAARFGTASVLVVNGRSYVVDCGRGAVSQYMRAGLPVTSLAAIFLTHLHSDHTADYFSFPLLLANGSQISQPFDVYGPGPAGENSLVPSAPGPLPGTAAMTQLAGQAFAASSSFFIAEHIAVDPTTLVNVHEIMPPASAGASLSDPAPTMTPFTVMENSDVKVTAVLVPHGAVFPAYAYRFDTDYGSVVFSGDTSATPNIPTLAKHADILVHEVVDLAAFQGQGLPPALIAHLAAVHTDVSLLGGIAAAADAKSLVVTHLSPGDPTLVSDDAWRKLLRASARTADYGGRMILGEDLMQIPVRRA
jgi:ribonuclease BN (tRNA processing enzyme)